VFGDGYDGPTFLFYLFPLLPFFVFSPIIPEPILGELTPLKNPNSPSRVRAPSTMGVPNSKVRQKIPSCFLPPSKMDSNSIFGLTATGLPLCYLVSPACIPRNEASLFFNSLTFYLLLFVAAVAQAHLFVLRPPPYPFFAEGDLEPSPGLVFSHFPPQPLCEKTFPSCGDPSNA